MSGLLASRLLDHYEEGLNKASVWDKGSKTLVRFPGFYELVIVVLDSSSVTLSCVL